MTDDLKPTRRRYIRVYYTDLEGDYPDVWFDPTCLSSWLRLLTLCDAAWPSPGKLPRSVRRADLSKLVAAGLVTLLDHDRFTMKGWEKERTERAEKARASVRTRYDRTTPVDISVNELSTAHAPYSPSASASTSDTKGVQGETADPADAYWSLTGRYPTDKVRDWLDDLGARYGAEPVIRHLAQRFMEDGKTLTLIGRVQDHLKSEARALDRKEQEDERERLREKRAIPKVVPQWEKEFRQALEQRYAVMEGRVS